MLDEFAYGRNDAKTIEQCGDYESIPFNNSGSLVSHLKERNFTDEEIVALASVEAFGELVDPEHSQISNFPKFDNYYFKKLLTTSDRDASSVPHYKELHSS